MSEEQKEEEVDDFRMNRIKRLGDAMNLIQAAASDKVDQDAEIIAQKQAEEDKKKLEASKLGLSPPKQQESIQQSKHGQSENQSHSNQEIVVEDYEHPSFQKPKSQVSPRQSVPEGTQPGNSSHNIQHQLFAKQPENTQNSAGPANQLNQNTRVSKMTFASSSQNNFMSVSTGGMQTQILLMPAGHSIKHTSGQKQRLSELSEVNRQSTKNAVYSQHSGTRKFDGKRNTEFYQTSVSNGQNTKFGANISQMAQQYRQQFEKNLINPSMTCSDWSGKGTRVIKKPGVNFDLQISRETAKRGFQPKQETHEERYKYNPMSDFNKQNPMRLSYTDFDKQPRRNTEALFSAGVNLEAAKIVSESDKKQLALQVGHTPLKRMPLYQSSKAPLDKQLRSFDLTATKPRWKSTKKSRRELLQEKTDKLSLMLNPPKDFGGCYNMLGHYTKTDTSLKFQHQQPRAPDGRLPQHEEVLPSHQFYTTSRIAVSQTSCLTRNKIGHHEADFRTPKSTLNKYSYSQLSQMRTTLKSHNPQVDPLDTNGHLRSKFGYQDAEKALEWQSREKKKIGFQNLMAQEGFIIQGVKNIGTRQDEKDANRSRPWREAKPTYKPPGGIDAAQFADNSSSDEE